MLLSMVPKFSKVAVLVNPDNASHPTILKNIQVAAQRMGVKILPVEARTPQQIEKEFALMVKEKAGALIVEPDAHFIQQFRQIAELTVKHRLPAIGGGREFVEVGGLMSYGSNLIETFRRAATYVDKILKGAKPGDLPVEQPTRYYLVINRKTANVLGIKITSELLTRADKIIE